MEFVSWDDEIPNISIYGEIKNVPNHQPNISRFWVNIKYSSNGYTANLSIQQQGRFLTLYVPHFRFLAHVSA